MSSRNGYQRGVGKPLQGYEVKEVTTRKSRTKLTEARANIELALKEEGMRADARVQGAGKRYGLGLR